MRRRRITLIELMFLIALIGILVTYVTSTYRDGSVRDLDTTGPVTELESSEGR